MQKLKRKMLLAAITAAIFVGATTAAHAWDGYLDVTNSTGYEIVYLYVSHSSTNDWEEDVLGNRTLKNGESFRITLQGYSNSIFDVRAVDVDGDTYTVMRVNAQTHNVNLTMSNLD